MKAVLKGVAAALLGPLVIGCATVRMGRDFDHEVLRAFERGKTTKAEVLATLGEPWMRSSDPDGNELWTYMYSDSSAFAVPLPFYTHVQMDQRTKSAVLTFRGDVLTKMTANIPQWAVPGSAPAPAPKP